MAAVKYWFPTAISCLCMTLGALATAEPVPGEAAASLEARLLAADGIVANFTQQITNAQGFVVEQASGTLQVAKPRFRWEVLAPFPQIIIADANELEVYDPDLEQVTTKTLDGTLDEAPLALLTQSELALAEQFAVELQSLELHRYTLRPLSMDALFDRMELVFLDDALLTLVIYDHTGQQTLIRFTEYRAGQVIQSEVFELEYPPGTDFVRG